MDFQLSSSLDLKEIGLVVSKLWSVEVALFIAAEKFLSLWKHRKVLVAVFLPAFGGFSASPLHKFFGQRIVNVTLQLKRPWNNSWMKKTTKFLALLQRAQSQLMAATMVVLMSTELRRALMVLVKRILSEGIV